VGVYLFIVLVCTFPGVSRNAERVFDYQLFRILRAVIFLYQNLEVHDKELFLSTSRVIVLIFLESLGGNGFGASCLNEKHLLLSQLRIPDENSQRSGGKTATIPLGKRPAFRWECGHHSGENGQDKMRV
jgi:hypothetical protein